MSEISAISGVSEVPVSEVSDVPVPDVSDVPAPEVLVAEVPAPEVLVAEVPVPEVLVAEVPAPEVLVAEVPASGVSASVQEVFGIPVPEVAEVPGPEVEPKAGPALVNPGQYIDNIPGITNGEILGKYKVLEYIGKGAFSKVVKAVLKPKVLEEREEGQTPESEEESKTFAIKMIARASSAKNEIKMLRALCKVGADTTTQIGRLIDYHHDAEIGFHYLVFPFYGPDLHTYLATRQGTLYFEDVEIIMKQLLSCMDFLGRYNIMHCDIKPSNIVFQTNEFYPYYYEPYRKICRYPKDPSIRLVDFGLAIVWDKRKDYRNVYIQTPMFRAPEVILGLGFKHAADMWSLGCTIFSIWMNHDLFPYENEDDTFQCGLIEKYLGPFPRWMQLANSHCSNVSALFDLKSGQVIMSPEIKAQVYNPRKYLSSFDVFGNGESDDKDFWDLLRKMIDISPVTRITPPEALDHVFFKKVKAFEAKYFGGKIVIPDDLKVTPSKPFTRGSGLGLGKEN